MMLHMVTSQQLPGWLQVWREVETAIKPRLAVLQTRRSVRQRATTARVTSLGSARGVSAAEGPSGWSREVLSVAESSLVLGGIGWGVGWGLDTIGLDWTGSDWNGSGWT